VAAVPRRWRLLGLIALVLVAFTAGGLAMALSRNSATAAGHPRADATALGAQAAARRQAASWVVQQVSRAAVVSCDPLMCSVLQGAGFPASNLLVLRPGDPGPLGSDLVVATAVLRSQFGSRLAAVYAPVVLAAFGTGNAMIDVRAIAPDGATEYLGQFRSDLAARIAAGTQLLRNRKILVSPATRLQLAAGQVDSRLLAMLAPMAALHSLRIAAFGDPAPGAGAGVPVTSVVLTAAGTGATQPTVENTVLHSLRAFLRAQQTPYLPAQIQIVRLAAGRRALRIQFAVPDPLGLLGIGHPVVKIPSKS
jgi:hypothetical protein